MSTGPRTIMSLTLTLATMSDGCAAAALAQTDVSVEVGTSIVGPAVGTETGAAHFGIAGVSASHRWLGGSAVSADLLVGRSWGRTTGGDFLSGAVDAALATELSAEWRAGLGVELLGFEIRAPFAYRALAAQGGPTLRYGGPSASLEIAGVAGLGRARLEARRTVDGGARVLNEDLWRLGGTAELLLGARPTWIGVATSVHRTAVGTYGSAGTRAVIGGDWGAAEVRVDVWDGPFGTEVTGGLALALPLGSRWSVRGFAGKSEPDPLTLAEPGSGSGGLLLAHTLHYADGPDGVSPLHEVVAATPGGARIRIGIEAPEGARRVDLLGDFTRWEPRPMHRDGARWIVELDVPPGTHHYGFLVDDEWYLPDDAPGLVPDGWGRHSATLVIEEGAGR